MCKTEPPMPPKKYETFRKKWKLQQKLPSVKVQLSWELFMIFLLKFWTNVMVVVVVEVVIGISWGGDELKRVHQTDFHLSGFIM